MQGLIQLGKWALGAFLAIKQFLPKIFVGLFLFFTFLWDLFTKDFTTAIRELSTKIFAAELKIHQMVTLAVQESPEYNLVAFITIINSLFILWFLVKWTGKLIFIGMTGSQAHVMAYAVALLVVAIIEYSTAVITTGSFTGFVPIKDGIIYLLLNIGPVFYNINWLGFSTPGAGPNGSNISIKDVKNNISALNTTE